MKFIALTFIALVSLYAVLGVAGGGFGRHDSFGSYERLTVYNGR